MQPLLFRGNKKIVGYITMTGDLPHEDHFRLLRACRNHCDFLIVGLVTDTLGVKQKRQPLLTYQHRRAIFEHCKYVDLVVEHDGDPKAVAWEKLHFDILFSSDEYFHSAEMKIFKFQCPMIPVIYFPKNHQTSTTTVVQQLMMRWQETSQILAVGITGNIIRQGFGPFFISKPIHFAEIECKNDGSTEDVFGFYTHFDELPRNWKSEHHQPKDVPQYPMIAGINSHRELAINMRLRKKKWCTYISANVVYQKQNHDDTVLPPAEENQEQPRSLLQFANDVARARQFPFRILHLIQRDAGPTFEQWCVTTCESVNQFQEKVSEIESIIHELQEESIVHGDIHPRNVLVDPISGLVSVIDFGWVMAKCFQMCPKERMHLDNALFHSFDYTHFHKSMRICAATRYWLEQQAVVVAPPAGNVV